MTGETRSRGISALHLYASPAKAHRAARWFAELNPGAVLNHQRRFVRTALGDEHFFAVVGREEDIEPLAGLRYSVLIPDADWIPPSEAAELWLKSRVRG